jgi:periplasmic divalent cation tolerance protein
MEIYQVVTTVDSAQAAQALAESAVRARVAACAQVDGPLTSTYWWRGQVETAQEWRVTFKTTAVRYAQLEAHVRAHHGYDVPEILGTAVVAGNPDYLRWIADETSTVD